MSAKKKARSIASIRAKEVIIRSALLLVVVRGAIWWVGIDREVHRIPEIEKT
jgi:hypothetical protein